MRPIAYWLTRLECAVFGHGPPLVGRCWKCGELMYPVRGPKTRKGGTDA